MTENLTLWEMVSLAIETRPRVLLYGIPGTGKTYSAVRHAVEGRETFVITVTPETAAAELRGHFIHKGEQEGFVWHDGTAVAAWRAGGRLVINEIGEASLDALTFLYAILDDPNSDPKLTLPNGETVRPAKGFQCIATTNEKPSVLPEALQDRFPVSINVDSPAPGAISALPEYLRHVAAQEIGGRYRLRQWREFASIVDDLTGRYDRAKARTIAARMAFPANAADIIDALELANASGSSDGWSK